MSGLPSQRGLAVCLHPTLTGNSKKSSPTQCYCFGCPHLSSKNGEGTALGNPGDWGTPAPTRRTQPSRPHLLLQFKAALLRSPGLLSLLAQKVIAP